MKCKKWVKITQIKSSGFLVRESQEDQSNALLQSSLEREPLSLVLIFILSTHQHYRNAHCCLYRECVSRERRESTMWEHLFRETG